MLWKKAKCFLGKHERDRGAAKFDGVIYHSRCKYCGVPMAKDFERGWIAVEGQGASPQGDPINTTLLPGEKPPRSPSLFGEKD